MRAFAGEPVAVALHAAGIDTLGRSSKYHRPRGFFCLDGHCASCYLRIDGRPNRRACVTPARAGLRCERQNAFPSADVDLLTAADWLFPEGMDHHTLMTGSRAGNALFLKLVREMGGSGMLPDAPPRRPPRAARDEALDVCVVGGGPAGLAAARALAEAAPGARVALFDEQATPGGSLLAAAGRRGARGGDGRGGPRRRRAARRAARPPSPTTPRTTEPTAGAGPAGGRDGDGCGACGRGAPLRDGRLRSEPALRRQRSAGHHLGARLRAAGVSLGRAPGAARERGDHPRRRADGRAARARAHGRGRRGRARRSGARARGRGARHQAGARARSPGGGRGARGSSTARWSRSPRLPSPASELPRQHGAAVAFEPARGGFAALVDERLATPAPTSSRAATSPATPAPTRPRATARRSGARSPRRWRWLAGARCRSVVCRGGCATPRDAARRRRAPPAATAPTRRPRSRAAAVRRRRLRPRRRRAADARTQRGSRSSTPPGRRCATSTTTRRWAASTGTRCAPATSRWRWPRPPRPPSTARSTR